MFVMRLLLRRSGVWRSRVYMLRLVRIPTMKRLVLIMVRPRLLYLVLLRRPYGAFEDPNGSCGGCVDHNV